MICEPIPTSQIRLWPQNPPIPTEWINALKLGITPDTDFRALCSCAHSLGCRVVVEFEGDSKTPPHPTRWSAVY